MARLVLFRGKGPVPVGDPPVYVCGCGLSRAWPYCTGAHIRVQDEDDRKVYAYDQEARRLGEAEAVRLRDGEEVPATRLYAPREATE